MAKPDPRRQPPLGAAEFDELYQRVKAKAVWGPSTGEARSITSRQRSAWPRPAKSAGSHRDTGCADGNRAVIR